MNLITNILNCIDVIAPLVTLFFFIKPFKRMPKELYYFFGFIGLQFIANLVAGLLGILEVKNYWVYLANVMFSFLLLSFLFYQLSSKAVKKIIPFASLGFIVFAIYSIRSEERRVGKECCG